MVRRSLDHFTRDLVTLSRTTRFVSIASKLTGPIRLRDTDGTVVMGQVALLDNVLCVLVHHASPIRL